MYLCAALLTIVLIVINLLTLSSLAFFLSVTMSSEDAQRRSRNSTSDSSILSAIITRWKFLSYSII